jgi:hypothetical protein
MHSQSCCGSKLAACRVLKVLRVPKRGHRRVECSLIGEQIGYVQDKIQASEASVPVFLEWEVLFDGVRCVFGWRGKLCYMSTFVNSSFMTVLCFSCVNSYTMSNSQSPVAVQNRVIFWLWMPSGSMDMATKDLPVWHYICPWPPEVIENFFFSLWSHETLGTIHSAALCKITEDFYIRTLW